MGLVDSCSGWRCQLVHGTGGNGVTECSMDRINLNTTGASSDVPVLVIALSLDEVNLDIYRSCYYLYQL